MDPIYVAGHRNPDTDSIVSAMAYAALRNSLGDGEFIPVRLGDVSDETQFILNRFGFEPPMRLRNIRTQVKDLAYDTPPTLSGAATIMRAWQLLGDDSQMPALPVVNEDGTLSGMLTPGDIAAYNMRALHDPAVKDVPVFNLISSLEGRVVNEEVTMPENISGEIVIALPQAQTALPSMGPDSIVICGQQKEAVDAAIGQKVACVVLCQASMDADFRNRSDAPLIISTPYDAWRAVSMLYQSVPVSRICRQEGVVSFRLDDFIDDVRDEVLKSRYRSYPVLDAENRVVGTLSRYHLLRPRRKRLILVDHNEVSQSLPGLDQAEILEIIDHHRLADVQTASPIYVRNEPVGSTATIIAGLYQERGVMPTPPMAGLLASAIASDTVLFRSPTCTPRDKLMAERMARIAGVSMEQLGREIFSATDMSNKPPEDLVFTDFKEFHIAGHDFGISQVTCLDADRMLSMKSQLLEIMDATVAKRRYNMMLMMLTDMLKEGSWLLMAGDAETAVSNAFNAEVKDRCVFLPYIISRKKQVVPMLSTLWA